LRYGLDRGGGAAELETLELTMPTKEFIVNLVLNPSKRQPLSLDLLACIVDLFLHRYYLY
jgi:hypothetical protein